MNLSKENKKLIILTLFFGIIYFIPFYSFIPTSHLILNAFHEALAMLWEYAKHHVLLALVPAFFIAGAIQVFVNQQAVISYLGPQAKKWISYTVASLSGSFLSVCSCTILPLFKGIYERGAGLGPAITFLYSGPAINILAIILTTRILGLELGIARTTMAIVFSLLIGFLMHLLFRKQDQKRLEDMGMFAKPQEKMPRKLYQEVVFLVSLMGILIFVNWSSSGENLTIWDSIYRFKYVITGFFIVLLVFSLFSWFKKEELKQWTLATRDFVLQMLPLLFTGVVISGFLLGRPGKEAIIPSSFITHLVGDNGFFSNFIASLFATLMYFATLTEIPILQSLIGAGMAKGPALALLLAGPSLSLPSLLVIHKTLGIKKTIIYAVLVSFLSALVGMIFGHLF